MNHEGNKAQAAYLSVMEHALSHEGAPFSIEKGSFRNLLTGGSSLGRYVFGSEISYNKAPPRLPGLGC